MIDSKDFMNDNYIPVAQGVMPLNTNEDNVVPVAAPEEERTAGGSPKKAMDIIRTAGTAAKIIKAIL